MKEFRGTKGEWNLRGETKSFPISNIITCTIEDGINSPFEIEICHVLPKAVIGTKLANAKLIAAAPDLLEALMSALPYLEQHALPLVKEKAEKAIIKALGE